MKDSQHSLCIVSYLYSEREISKKVGTIIGTGKETTERYELVGIELYVLIKNN